MAGLLSGIASASSGVSTLVTSAISAGGSILNFGIDHPVLTGIVGVFGYEALKGAMDAKENESMGVAAANGIGGLVNTIKDIASGLIKGAGDAAKEITDATTTVMTNGAVEDVTELGNNGVENGVSIAQEFGDAVVDTTAEVSETEPEISM